VKLNVREGLKAASVTKLSLKVAQNEQKRSKSRKQKIVAILQLAKGFSWILCQIAKRRFHFSRPPVSTTHPLLHL
jgi:hypothetical protein